MNIKMLETRTVAVDNFTVEILKKGEEYDVRQSVGCHLISEGHAEGLDETPPLVEALGKISQRFNGENI